MTAGVVVYALMLGAVVSLCAVAAEHLTVALSARTSLVPARRFVWLAAMVACALVPVAVAVLPMSEVAGVVATSDAAALAVPQVAPEPSIWRDAGALLVNSAQLLGRAVSDALQATGDYFASFLAPYSGLLLTAWLSASLVAIAAIVLLAFRLGRARRTWQPHSVDDVPVLLSEDAGPAVVGFWSGSIVLPSWLLTLGAPLRALVLRHELEHVRARDAGALSLAALCLLIQPWNPALWWQFRRLRMAIELDCDARVIRAGADVERYGLLLLAVGQRTRRSITAVAALAEDRTLLARRIAIMSEPKISNPLPRIALWSAAAAVGLLVACEVPDGDRAVAPDDPSVLSAEVAGEGAPYFEFQVDQPVSANIEASKQPSYPADLRAAGVSGQVLVQFVVNGNGDVEIPSFKVVESDHAGFTEAVRSALPHMKFNPAQVDGVPVRQLVQQPFMFAIK